MSVDEMTILTVPHADGPDALLPFVQPDLPRSVYPRSVDLSAGQVFAVHAHRWNQFTYATSGSLIISLQDVHYVITPEQAIWIPTGTIHTSGSRGGASLRSVYIADRPDLAMPDRCAVLSVSPFLRSLIIELDAGVACGEDDAYLDHVSALLVSQVQRATSRDLSLPWPRSEALRHLCGILYDAPDDARSLDQWGAELAISSRTLARRFEHELGMTLRDWRRRLRLFRGLEWLGEGGSVTRIALDLGYASPSAFSYMFRLEMGCSPAEWQMRRRDRI